MTDPSERVAGSGRASCDNREACEKRICDKDRRRLLGALATGGALSLAGCTGMFARASPETEREQYDIEYTSQRRTIQAHDGQTILGAGEEAGLELPYDCRAGFCGVCLSRANGDASELVNMRINDFELLTDEAIEAGYFLPCTSQPRTHMKVDTSVGTADLLEFQEESEEEEDEEDEEDEDAERVPRHTVTYLLEQWSIEVPEDQNILEAGEERGLDLPYQCRVGNCGQCLSQADGDASELIEMTANNYGPLDDDAIEDGYFLTCTGQPRDDFTFESEKYGDIS